MRVFMEEIRGFGEDLSINKIGYVQFRMTWIFSVTFRFGVRPFPFVTTPQYKEMTINGFKFLYF
jgi:hypothetical protein